MRVFTSNKISSREGKNLFNSNVLLSKIMLYYGSKTRMIVVTEKLRSCSFRNIMLQDYYKLLNDSGIEIK